MSLFDWLDKNLFTKIMGAIIIGLAAASTRAMREKDGPKKFLARLVSGVLVGGVVGFMLSETEVSRIPYGMIMWCCGWFGGELGALFASGGKKTLEGTTGMELDEEEAKEKAKEEDTNTPHEPNPTDKPVS